MSKDDWVGFLEKEKEYLQFMNEKYESMFDGDKIKHFDIVLADWGLGWDTVDKIKEQYWNDIQKELVRWITKEKESGELINQNNWRPFRDSDLIITMREGYRKLFIFNNYCFQLCIDDECEEECLYCSKPREYFAIHFALLYHGWISEEDNKVYPFKNMTVLPDKLYPEKKWKYRM